MDRQDIDERFEIYHVKIANDRLERQFIFVGTTDTAEGIGTALVQWAEDRAEAGNTSEDYERLPRFAVYDAGLDRWVCGPADPTRAPREYAVRIDGSLTLPQLRADEAAHERMTGQQADDTGYDISDPKHPDHHDVFSGLADDR